MTRRTTGRTAPGGSGLVQRIRARLSAAPTANLDPIVLGFSGGSDSLALASVLATIQLPRGPRVLAVHVDHGLRTDSADEQAAAAALAVELGLEFHGVRLESGLRERHHGVGLEEAARRERYVALAQVAMDSGASVIALGHHASDQAETVLLHLLRGSGVSGARGMAEWSERAIPWWDDGANSAHMWVWRPLLSESKATILAYESGLDLVPIEDPSNAGREFTRNRIRQDVLPLLEDISAGATSALGRFAEVAAADDDLLETLAIRSRKEIGGADGGLSAAGLLREHLAIQRRVVRMWLASRLGTSVEVSLNRIDAVIFRARSGEGNRWIEIGAGWGVTLVGGQLVCSRQAESSTAHSAECGHG